MNYKSIICIMTVCVTQSIFSQTVKVEYLEKKNIPAEKLAQLPPQVVQMLSKQIPCKLVHSQGKSIFEFQEETKGNLEMNIQTPKREAYFKNKVTQELITFATLADEKFIVADVLPKIEWNIENETQKIGDYECQKATGAYKAATIVAWFAVSIPVNDGPLMLGGLPGLIVKASINNMMTYEATKIVIEKENSTLAPSTKGKAISAVDFEKLKLKVAEETLARQKEAGATHIEVK
jgi:GLPGLI family protein